MRRANKRLRMQINCYWLARRYLKHLKVIVMTTVEIWRYFGVHCFWDRHKFAEAMLFACIELSERRYLFKMAACRSFEPRLKSPPVQPNLRAKETQRVWPTMMLNSALSIKSSQTGMRNWILLFDCDLFAFLVTEGLITYPSTLVHTMCILFPSSCRGLSSFE